MHELDVAQDDGSDKEDERTPKKVEGFNVHSFAYCTGLLLACRVLKTLQMDDEYEGSVEGFNVHSFAYCTGLLLACRVLKRHHMDDEYDGSVEATGEDYPIEPTGSRCHFRLLFDAGLLRTTTTTGNHVLGALEGILQRDMWGVAPFDRSKGMWESLWSKGMQGIFQRDMWGVVPSD